jgi:DNA-binding transcriptional LysR family regulator
MDPGVAVTRDPEFAGLAAGFRPAIVSGVELRIGCAPDVPLQRLQAFIGLLAARGVDFREQVRHLPTALQLRQLRAGDLDVGLLHDAGPSPGIEVERLYRGEALAAVVSVAHRVALAERARLEDLAGDALLVMPRTAEPSVHDRVAALAATDGVVFREVREAPGADVRDLLFAVASGHGVTALPRSTMRVVGDLGEALATPSLAPSVWMPDTCLAWSAHARRGLSSVYDAARHGAREMYRASCALLDEPVPQRGGDG